MIRLGTIVLPDLVWAGRHTWAPVAAVEASSLAGAPVSWERPRSGRPIDLVGGDDYGWLDHATLLALRDLAATPGAVLTLEYEGQTIPVRWRHADSPVIVASPLVPRVNPEADDRYKSVTLKLQEAG